MRATSCHDLVRPNLGIELIYHLELRAHYLSAGLFNSHDKGTRYDNLYCMLPILVSSTYMLDALIDQDSYS